MSSRGRFSQYCSKKTAGGRGCRRRSRPERARLAAADMPISRGYTLVSCHSFAPALQAASCGRRRHESRLTTDHDVHTARRCRTASHFCSVFGTGHPLTQSRHFCRISNCISVPINSGYFTRNDGRLVCRLTLCRAAGDERRHGSNRVPLGQFLQCAQQAT